MSKTDELKDALVEKVFSQIIASVEIDGDVYVESDVLAPLLTEIVKEVLEEVKTREVIKEKVRVIIANIDDERVSRALEPDLGRGFFRRLFGG